MSPEPSDVEGATEPRFAFRRLIVPRAVFEVVDRAPISDGETRPRSVTVGLQVSAQVNVDIESKVGALTLDVKVLPDLKWQPYRIEIVVTGVFAGLSGTLDDLVDFCRVGAPSILFPYIRENVHRMTFDAPDGQLRLDPMNLQELINRGPWSEATFDPTTTQPPSR